METDRQRQYKRSSVKKCLVINYTCKYHVLLDTSLLSHQHEMFNIQGMFVCTLPGIAGIKTFKGWSNVCFKILRGFTNIIPGEFFVWSSCSTRGHSMKLYYSDYSFTVRQIFFSVRARQLFIHSFIVLINPCLSSYVSCLLRSLYTHWLLVARE